MKQCPASGEKSRRPLTLQRTSYKLALVILSAGSFEAAKCQVAAPIPASGDPQVIGAEAPPIPVPEVKFNLPHVTCNNGQLTIRAKSSTMRSVLGAIQSCLGIPIEVPATVTYEPVFLELGPGPVNGVLSDLLSLTDLDFIVVSSETDPSTIVKVELSGRTPDGEKGSNNPVQATGQMSPARLAWMAARNVGRGMPPQEAESTSASDQAQSGSPQGDGAAGAKDATASASSTDQATNSAGVGSPAEVGPVKLTSADTNQVNSTDNGLQNQITDMQRLFDERKKLNQNPSDPKVGNSAPAASAGPSAVPPSL
jgi:hypothetical protein